MNFSKRSIISWIGSLLLSSIVFLLLIGGHVHIPSSTQPDTHCIQCNFQSQWLPAISLSTQVIQPVRTVFFVKQLQSKKTKISSTQQVYLTRAPPLS